MTEARPFLRLNRLRVMSKGRAAYDQTFHEGVNIIRGQNGSGKSTIADFIFFVLGGEFDDWKAAASQCDEVQAEVETPRGRLTVKRQLANGRQGPATVYFGSFEAASKSSLDNWEVFPLRRVGGRESFSQVMFRSMLIPEAQSEGASNITMHQILRLCYSDQRTPASRLFRYETWDTQNIREAVGDLICGISGYELYEIGLTLRDKEKRFGEIATKLSGLLRALPARSSLHSPAAVRSQIEELRRERERLNKEVEGVDAALEPGEVSEYLQGRRAAAEALVKLRTKLQAEETASKESEYEVREVEEFLAFLAGLTEKLQLAEATYKAVGEIDFIHCPACGEELTGDVPAFTCVVCKTPQDPEKERSRYNQIRLDLEIQTRESRQLLQSKQVELAQSKQKARALARDHEQALGRFDLQYSGANGPREAFLAIRTSRIGSIDSEIEYFLQSLDTAEEIEKLSVEKAALQDELGRLKGRAEALRDAATKRRGRALTRTSDIAAGLLRADLPRQEEFVRADHVELSFVNDSISVDGRVNFAESSNVFLKNAAILSLFLAAAADGKFYHPSFLLLDNIEDKGMQEDRSHLFQRLVVEQATEIRTPYQVIFTTSMMNPELELDDYVIGPAYTSAKRSLDLVS